MTEKATHRGPNVEHSRVLCGSLVVLFLVAVAAPGCRQRRPEALIAVELEGKLNTLDGCTACGCRAKGELKPGGDLEWWVFFGLVASDGEGGWKALASSSHCGNGSFDKSSASFSRAIGHPYLLLHLSTKATATPAGDTLEMKLRLGEFRKFAGDGKPVYEWSTQERSLRFSSEGDVALPVLIADQREKDAFGIHEMILRLRATILRKGTPAAYGVVSVSADVPGAEILLDGGFVGRVAGGEPVLLKNVRVGARDLRVRDFSGREAKREITVKRGKTADVTLKLLDVEGREPKQGLVPINKNPQGYEEYWRLKDGAMLVKVPAGEFLMGSPEGQGQPDERPQHRVHVSEFLIDKNEVTWRQFRKFAKASGAELPRIPVYGAPDDYPVSFVLWDQARAYCAWVGGRLPTEAEWEKAARGTDGRAYPFGDTWDATKCNTISGGLHEPHAVGSYPDCLSPYGVLDMAGSMWEWCADLYGERYYAESPATDPKGPTSGSLRVKRGGAWMSQPTWVRAGYRAKGSPVSPNVDHGFRCAQKVPK